MRFQERILIGTLAVSVAALSAGAATAYGYSGGLRAAAGHSYTGSYPITVTKSQRSNGTGCLTLTDNGSFGQPHSGSATLVFGSQKFTFGTFQVINRELFATIQAQGYGQNAGLVFVGAASRGIIGQGFFEDVYGGEDFDSGALAFGTKGGC
jgi:hypothetical protein